MKIVLHRAKHAGCLQILSEAKACSVAVRFGSYLIKQPGVVQLPSGGRSYNTCWVSFFKPNAENDFIANCCKLAP